MTITPPDIPPGPRAIKEVGSADWCWQTLGLLKLYLANIDQRWRDASDIVGELEGVQAWKVLGYSSFSKMCDDQLGMAAQVVRHRIDVERTKALGQHGGDRSAEQGDNITLLGRGTDPTYAVARLKRDRPDLAEKVRTGELSPHAAAVEAGFRHKTITVRADSAEAALRTLIRHYTWDELLDALNGIEQPPGPRQ